MGPARALTAMLCLGPTGCLLPADRPPPDDERNFPPLYDPETLSPAEPAIVYAVPEAEGTNCRIPFSARLFDDDDLVLRVRWVFDNKKTIVRLDDEREVNLEAGSRLVTRSIDTRDLSPPLVGVPHTVSLFITDAPGWAVSQADIEAGTTPETDYGRIVRGAEGGAAAGPSVAEVRWFLSFQEGACGPR